MQGTVRCRQRQARRASVAPFCVEFMLDPAQSLAWKLIVRPQHLKYMQIALRKLQIAGTEGIHSANAVGPRLPQDTQKDFESGSQWLRLRRVRVAA